MLQSVYYPQLEIGQAILILHLKLAVLSSYCWAAFPMFVWQEKEKRERERGTVRKREKKSSVAAALMAS